MTKEEVILIPKEYECLMRLADLLGVDNTIQLLVECLFQKAERILIEAERETKNEN